MKKNLVLAGLVVGVGMVISKFLCIPALPQYGMLDQFLSNAQRYVMMGGSVAVGLSVLFSGDK